MPKNRNISMAVIRRLPKYNRCLKDLLDKEIYRISSKELSVILGFTASQIRQDLNNFGGFGQQGYGYNVEELYHEIQKILGLTRDYKAVVVGVGNLGQAIANHTNFEEHGFKILAMFDINPTLIGLQIRGTPVLDNKELRGFIKANDIEIGVITTPVQVAQSVADELVEAGIKAIWNFAPMDLKVPDDVVVEDVHLNESLFIMSYLIKEKALLKSLEEPEDKK